MSHKAFLLTPTINNNDNKSIKEKLIDYEKNTREYFNSKFHMIKK